MECLTTKELRSELKVALNEENSLEAKNRKRLERALYRALVPLVGKAIDNTARIEAKRRSNRIIFRAAMLGWIGGGLSDSEFEELARAYKRN